VTTAAPSSPLDILVEQGSSRCPRVLQHQHQRYLLCLSLLRFFSSLKKRAKGSVSSSSTLFGSDSSQSKLTLPQWTPSKSLGSIFDFLGTLAPEDIAALANRSLF
jgi:hypothetical protein